MTEISARPRIACLGALVVDLTFWAPYRPRPGETLLGTRFEEFLGGKGFNQATAAARLGGDVAMIGAVGDDRHGARFLTSMQVDGIDPNGVSRVSDGTSVGQPLVTDDGDVSIIVIPRANAQVTVELVERHAKTIARSGALVVQCEVPVAASRRAAEIAREHGVLVVVNPVPVGPESPALVERADVLIVNELEAAMLLETPEGEPGASAAVLRERFGCLTVVTLGAHGALVHDGTVEQVLAHDVPAVDPTGAGDAFVGAFTVRLAAGYSASEALAFANAAGACAVRAAGAEPSMPRVEEVENLLARVPGVS